MGKIIGWVLLSVFIGAAVLDGAEYRSTYGPHRYNVSWQ